MKLKNKYVLRTVADKTVAIAVENTAEQTDGVVTLNSTGAFIFKLLNDGYTREKIIESFFKEYDVTNTEAETTVDEFFKSLLASGLAEE